MYRLNYLEEIANYTSNSYENLLKKEAGCWFDQILSEVIPSGGITKWRFIIKNKRITNTYFQYDLKHCHIYFNNALPLEYSTFYTLRKTFHLSEGDIHTMLRLKFKKFFIKLGIPVDKRIKIFFNRYLI